MYLISLCALDSFINSNELHYCSISYICLWQGNFSEETVLLLKERIIKVTQKIESNLLLSQKMNFAFAVMYFFSIENHNTDINDN